LSSLLPPPPPASSGTSRSARRRRAVAPPSTTPTTRRRRPRPSRRRRPTPPPPARRRRPKKTEPAASVDGARKELALFLSGDAWHDEIGWQALWEKDGVPAPDAWLRQTGKEVLLAERQKLTDHPALLAGCRRRWIVVCRYAGIDVGEAATLWNDA
jgi:hypothetical protein